MPPQAQVHRISEFAYLLKAGGVPFLAFGFLLAVIGVALAIRRGPRTAIIIISCLSPLPGIIAMCAIYSACAQFTDMASSPNPPKPAEFARVTGYAMSSGFFGILGTVASMATALVALARSRTQHADSSTG